MAYTTIKDPSAYFQTKLYTGGTVGAKTFDGNSNLKPDWFWSKKRGASEDHQTADSVRGIANSLRPNTTIAEYTNSETDDLASFDTNGFTFNGTGDTYNGTTTASNYVAWCWSAGGGTTTSNTDGSITSTVSANTTSGFSIVKWTGTGSSGTIGHGLGVAPKVVIVKRYSAVADWVYYTTAIDGSLDFLYLNKTDAKADSSASVPTSTVFSKSDTNNETQIAYCFAEKTGYSKFGSYTGNGNADGPFIYTGFKPAWVMIKRTDITNNWIILDNKRDTDNPNNVELQANSSNAEDTANIRFDMLSNGWKTRATTAANNASGGSYIYMAFAEEPLVGDNPATAR